MGLIVGRRGQALQERACFGWQSKAPEVAEMITGNTKASQSIQVAPFIQFTMLLQLKAKQRRRQRLKKFDNPTMNVVYFLL